eukprot:UN10239
MGNFSSIITILSGIFGTNPPKQLKENVGIITGEQLFNKSDGKISIIDAAQKLFTKTMELGFKYNDDNITYLDCVISVFQFCDEDFMIDKSKMSNCNLAKYLLQAHYEQEELTEAIWYYSIPEDGNINYIIDAIPTIKCEDD